MKSIVLKLALVVVLASSLSGCIVYVSPDKDHIHIYHSKDGAPSDEKPAATVDKTPT